MVIADIVMLGGGVAGIISSFGKRRVGNLVAWGVAGCILAGLTGSMVRLVLCILFLLRAKQQSDMRRAGIAQ